MSVKDELFQVSSDFEKKALILFWQWARFPENQDKLEALERDRAIVESMIKLSFNVFSSREGRKLMSDLQIAMLEVIERVP